MKKKLNNVFLIAIGAISLALVVTATGQSKARPVGAETQPAQLRPLELSQKLPLAIPSHPVEWKNNTYHLVTLGSIQFELDKETSQLKAQIQGSTTTFDNVDYDISAAVFDARGALLGTARTECKVQRVWLGTLVASPSRLALDFGTSLDYASASSFSVSISRRKVLTPDDWQLTK